MHAASTALNIIGLELSIFDKGKMMLSWNTVWQLLVRGELAVAIDEREERPPVSWPVEATLSASEREQNDKFLSLSHQYHRSGQ